MATVLIAALRGLGRLFIILADFNETVEEGGVRRALTEGWGMKFDDPDWVDRITHRAGRRIDYTIGWDISPRGQHQRRGPREHDMAWYAIDVGRRHKRRTIAKPRALKKSNEEKRDIEAIIEGYDCDHLIHGDDIEAAWAAISSALEDYWGFEDRSRGRVRNQEAIAKEGSTCARAATTAEPVHVRELQTAQPLCEELGRTPDNQRLRRRLLQLCRILSRRYEELGDFGYMNAEQAETAMGLRLEEELENKKNREVKAWKEKMAQQEAEIQERRRRREGAAKHGADRPSSTTRSRSIPRFGMSSGLPPTPSTAMTRTTATLCDASTRS